ncbi:ABC transporter ATP-binding protein [Sediminibacillus albus]|uniref:Teichoic acid transport system ATP-binding protein n=1 Tax=Sediminibacillus albus TaxID=407036 RepID=A0A1G8ZF06_9BACI|nr:ABC transporter ATP-binding protein [Sediminibacillus albus]SDK13689.1 teichoic acid transport system ATP-binding protein [Sediminibacillus albus]
MEKPIVKLTNVSKSYNLYKRKSDLLLEMFSYKQDKKTFSALKNISFEVYKGETIGVIGINGSGKSTLSNILAQVVPASAGEIVINGDPSLVAISAGLNNFVTGRENIELKCLMHGLKKEEIDEITPDIIEFADIGDFIDQPIKNYSSGMKSRLGFAISVHIQPDILVVDEALSVGDSTFYKKCLDKFEEFKSEGKTIFFISHSLPQVQAISDRILWLNFGEVQNFDQTETVVKEYKTFIDWFNGLTTEQKKEYRSQKLRGQIRKGNKHYPSGTRNLSRRKKKRREKNPMIQLSLLIALFLFSTLLMFVDNPVQAIQQGLENINNEEAPEKIEEASSSHAGYSGVETNYTAWINVEKTYLYNDVNFVNKLKELSFGSKVKVIEKMEQDSIFRVETGGVTGYLTNDHFVVLKEDEVASNLKLEDFIEIFPDRFAESYEFFFAFLGSDVNEMKESTNGITEEYDENGYKIYEFAYEDMAYIVNENGKVNAIEIENLDLKPSLIKDISNEVKIKSTDGNLYHLKLDDYIVDINTKSGLIQFKVE